MLKLSSLKSHNINNNKSTEIVDVHITPVTTRNGFLIKFLSNGLQNNGNMVEKAKRDVRSEYVTSVIITENRSFQ